MDMNPTKDSRMGTVPLEPDAYLVMHILLPQM